jgi:hypothetical protein
MTPRTKRRVRNGLHLVGMTALAVLYGSAYGALHVYGSLFIDAFGVADHWAVGWFVLWTVAGAVFLAMWTTRWVRTDGQRFQRDKKWTADTFTQQGATP